MPEKQYEIIALALRYWFVALIGYIFIKNFLAAASVFHNDKRKAEGNTPVVMVLLSLSTFGLLALKASGGADAKVFVLGILLSAIFLFQYYFLQYLFSGLDEHLLLMVNTLMIIGAAVLQRLNPEMAFRQVEWFGLASVSLLLSLIIIRYLKDGRRYYYPLMGIGIVLLLLALFLGKEIGGSRNWFSLGQYNVQPSEFVKIILIIVFAIDFRDKKPFLQRIPIFAFAALAILLVVLQRDLGAALLYFTLFIFLYYIGTSDWLVTGASAGLGGLGAVASYYLFSHVRVRVAAWKNPWADVEGKGYQIVQSLIAIGSGGLFGLGLGMGMPETIPASKTDFIFAAVCEEMGILVGIFIIGFYAMIVVRGTAISLRADNAFDALLAMGATVTLAVQSFIIIGGVIKMIPLTGVTLPFVSYGGSSMLVSFSLVGIIQGIATKNTNGSEEDMEFLQKEEGEGKE